VLPPVLAVVAAVAAALALRLRREGLSFTATAFAIGLTVASIFTHARKGAG
jgi:predicted transcriptional regulator